MIAKNVVSTFGRHPLLPKRVDKQGMSVLIGIIYRAFLFGHSHILRVDSGTVGNANVTWMFPPSGSWILNSGFFILRSSLPLPIPLS